LRVTVSGLEARVGDLLQMGDGPDAIFAEGAAIDGDKLSCLPLGPLAGIGGGTPVTSTGGPLRVAVGPDLRGRILDGLGRPMDGGPPLLGEPVSLARRPPAAGRAVRDRGGPAVRDGAPARRRADAAGRPGARHPGAVRPRPADR